MATFVIADIHGHMCLFDAVLNQLPIVWGTDTLVVLGDVLDRGPAVGEVIARLIDLQAQYAQVVVIRGNHEVMLLQALQSEQAFQAWLKMGGDATYRAYCPPTRHLRRDLLVRSLPASVQHFLATLPATYQNADGVYAHLGATQTADGQWELKDPATARWVPDPHFFRTYTGPPLVVGHTPTSTVRALVGETPARDAHLTAWMRGALLAIDCDVSSGGPLCAVELPARTFYYAHP